nr:MAG TPA: hypothetical protein [Caudoviricetes sp.]
MNKCTTRNALRIYVISTLLLVELLFCIIQPV